MYACEIIDTETSYVRYTTRYVPANLSVYTAEQFIYLHLHDAIFPLAHLHDDLAAFD